ncbi:hypothetical protein KQI30_07585 [Clostridium bornimense]|uniref:hypothetical protein n=1 Tax=Clostridium bornimense TaxID=1216932 RepID=UPI001C0FC1FD|nr:hypothetical protein [Clostridium bornimense]MBU5316131.1 hypothetical protein [Clostridium bornimense]
MKSNKSINNKVGGTLVLVAMFLAQCFTEEFVLKGCLIAGVLLVSTLIWTLVAFNKPHKKKVVGFIISGLVLWITVTIAYSDGILINISDRFILIISVIGFVQLLIYSTYVMFTLDNSNEKIKEAKKTFLKSMIGIIIIIVCTTLFILVVKWLE